MRRRIVPILVLLVLFLLTGCAGKQETGGDSASVVVGFSQLGAESSWRIANTVSMEQAAKAAGYGLMMENANQKQEKQIDAIRSFIAYRVDVIVFSPIVQTGWDNVLAEAKQADIPVIIMDRMIDTQDDSLYRAYVGADFYAEGVRAGEYLIRKADTLGADHLRIVEICGTTGSTPMQDRQRGFMDVIGKDERFTVIESVDGDFLQSKGEECMRELLQKYGTDGIDVIYSHNDAMTLGALNVLEKEETAGSKDMIIITVDGEKDAVDALKAGKINCVVQCTPHLGPSVMKLVRDVTAGKEIPKVYHPDEGAFSDFDDLTDPAVEGF
ncbi:ABC transporter substrate-binding protein [Aristaeella hokkaidonensis]|uniref:ABC transporter substrate-binding protein n=1 Tax=Aristaeella hokkaidonensis TaxID=3046382 RepID=A0AC61MXA3_9FIRM|nr:ABC transporter substrate-binding protein [Aristaeella hokkaidonensis]QUC67337.1 ABC transporter substrate-binding protein [Aristaeella hokkaidonensis]SNT93329.1 simple sugar transport system substrate-binding protein [Aristaeella hokkaidonensis]